MQDSRVESIKGEYLVFHQESRARDKAYAYDGEKRGMQ